MQKLNLTFSKKINSTGMKGRQVRGASGRRLENIAERQEGKNEKKARRSGSTDIAVGQGIATEIMPLRTSGRGKRTRKAGVGRNLVLMNETHQKKKGKGGKEKAKKKEGRVPYTPPTIPEIRKRPFGSREGGGNRAKPPISGE